MQNSRNPQNQGRKGRNASLHGVTTIDAELAKPAESERDERKGRKACLHGVTTIDAEHDATRGSRKEAICFRAFCGLCGWSSCSAVTSTTVVVLDRASARGALSRRHRHFAHAFQIPQNLILTAS
jgi:hypothetical protein